MAYFQPLAIYNPRFTKPGLYLLKYLDLIHLVGADIKCPACNGHRCRRSRWLSKHEKKIAADYRPYRCNDCANRFLVTKSAAQMPLLINGSAGLILGLAMLAGVDHWLGRADVPAPEEGAIASTISAEKLAPGKPEITVVRSGVADAADDAGKAIAGNINSLKRAAEDGHPDSMVAFGRALASGEKISRNAEQAAKWMQLAASAGNAEGMFELGRFYRDGVGLAKDPVRAYVWFSRASAANNPDAMAQRDALVRTMSKKKLKEAQSAMLSTEGAGEIVYRKQGQQ